MLTVNIYNLLNWMQYNYFEFLINSSLNSSHDSLSIIELSLYLSISSILLKLASL